MHEETAYLQLVVAHLAPDVARRAQRSTNSEAGRLEAGALRDIGTHGGLDEASVLSDVATRGQPARYKQYNGTCRRPTSCITLYSRATRSRFHTGHGASYRNQRMAKKGSSGSPIMLNTPSRRVGLPCTTKSGGSGEKGKCSCHRRLITHRNNRHGSAIHKLRINVAQDGAQPVHRNTTLSQPRAMHRRKGTSQFAATTPQPTHSSWLSCARQVWRRLSRPGKRVRPRTSIKSEPSSLVVQISTPCFVVLW